jgi:hypothetical protein
VTLFEFLSLKNDVNVASKSHKQKVKDENRRIRIQDPDPDPNPDPLVRGMDLRIRIHPKMSWIRDRNTAFNRASDEIFFFCSKE